MIVTGRVSIGLVGCNKEFSVEVEDDCTDDEIDEVVHEHMMRHIVEWGWKRES